MNAPLRRGACPALSAPMRTGDGLLVRLNPVAAGLSPSQLAGLCEAAVRHGSGEVEVTARGSFQIRGLDEAGALLLAAEVDALGIAVRTGVPVEIGPLAGLDPAEVADPRALAGRLRTRIGEARLEGRLGPKVSVIVDGGGRSGLGAVIADVRLAAVRTGEVRWRVSAGGDAAHAIFVAELDEAAACDAALAILEALAAQGSAARARDLQLPELQAIVGQVASPSEVLLSAPSETSVPLLPGATALTDGRNAVCVALAFGSMAGSRLAAFCDAVRQHGTDEIRLAPGRMLVALCPPPSTSAVQAAAAASGLIVAHDDPRLAISACPGSQGCASGRIPTRDIAGGLASLAGGLLDGALPIHVSGCAKGCARPGEAALTLVGGENEAGLVVAGTARSLPLAYSPAAEAPRRLRAVLTFLARERRDGEGTADCLARIGAPHLAAVFAQDP